MEVATDTRHNNYNVCEIALHNTSLIKFLRARLTLTWPIMNKLGIENNIIISVFCNILVSCSK